MTATTRLPPFHLAISVDELSAARSFYGTLLGCCEGRSAASWVDFDFFGHQLVCHKNPHHKPTDPMRMHNQVDGDSVPVPHFGVVLDMPQWQQLAQRLQQANVDFVIPPTLRFAGQVGEQATLFLYDPAGNALEFKAFADLSELFTKT